MEDKLNIIEVLHENNTMYFYLGLLISSDNLYTLDDYEKSLTKLYELKNNIDSANINDEQKNKYLTYIDEGINILKQEMKQFK